MSNLSLPYNIIQDQQNQVKASSTHVQGNFSALETAVNSRLDLDGSNSPTADISMASHKLTNLATPTISGDATTKGYVDSALLLKADLTSPTFTGTPKAPTVASLTDNSTNIATTGFVLNALKTIYPVDSIYIGTGTTCPLAALFGTWTRIDAGLALWTGNGTQGNGSSVNTTTTGATNKINAGLPQHTHTVVAAQYYNNGCDGGNSAARIQNGNVTITSSGASNSIYGNSSTVQPPAYVVNVWRRTA